MTSGSTQAGRLKRSVAVVSMVIAAIGGSGLTATTASAAVTTPAPAITNDPNASNGSVTFYNASGAVLTSGSSLTHLFDYARASTNGRAGASKGTLYFAFPDHTQADSQNWFTAQATASTNYPNATYPAPLNTATQPVAKASASDANLAALLPSTTQDTTAGYDGILQIRLYDTGPGVAQTTTFWATDIYYNKVAGTWQQVFPAPAAATAPGAPTSASATAGNMSASVTFTGPASNGGAAISGYTATATPGGATGSISGSAATPITVSGLTNSVSYTFTVHATNSVGNSPESAPSNAVIPAAASGSTFTALATARIFDASVGTTPVAVTVGGVGGVPADATAVAVNVEVFAPTAAGYLRVTPFGSDPSVAVQEFKAGQAISNLVVVKLVSGKIQAKVSAGSARVLMDVAGYYSSSTSGSTLTALPSARIFDATVGTTPSVVTVAGVGGVPSDATAVIVNVEVFAPSKAGYLRVTPFGSDPSVAVQEFTAGKSISNLVMVKLVSGKIQAKVSAGSARVLMDVAGYYSSSTSGSTLTALPTARIFDATVGTTPSAVTVAGVGGVPANATAVIVNVEVFAPTKAGYVRVTPFGSDPSVAVQEFGAGEAISNLVVVKVVSGKIQAKVSAGSARVLMDVAGYYS